MAKQRQPALLRVSLLSMQVCVPDDFTDEEVEGFANSIQPTGISSRWAIRKAGDKSLSGDPERNPCAEREGCVHIMLDC